MIKIQQDRVSRLEIKYGWVGSRQFSQDIARASQILFILSHIVEVLKT